MNVLRFVGALPPQSQLVIEGNTFNFPSNFDPLSEFTGGNVCSGLLDRLCVAFVVVRGHETDNGFFDLVGSSVVTISNSLLTVPADDAQHGSSASITALVAASIASALSGQIPNGVPLAGVCNGSIFRIFRNRVEVAASDQRPHSGLAAVVIDYTPFSFSQTASGSNCVILVSDNSAFLVTANSVTLGVSQALPTTVTLSVSLVFAVFAIVPILLTGNSMFVVGENSISVNADVVSTVTVCFLWLVEVDSLPISLGNNSAVRVDANMVRIGPNTAVRAELVSSVYF